MTVHNSMLGLPGMERRRIIRSLPNPIDKCTLVSIYPKDIREERVTIQPSRYFIPAGTLEKPSLTIVGGASWWREVDDQYLEIPTSSIQIASSLVDDWSNGMMGCNMDDKRPGLFFEMGEFHDITKIPNIKERLADAHARQRNWFQEIVDLSDILWARSNGNPLSISDQARMAASHLNLHDKPWLKDYKLTAMVPCKACGALKNPEFPVCQACRTIIDPAAYAKSGFKQLSV